MCGFYADGLNKIALPHKTHPLEICESRSPAKGQDPQMFRNCADIKITGDGTGATTGPIDMEDDSYEPTDVRTSTTPSMLQFFVHRLAVSAKNTV